MDVDSVTFARRLALNGGARAIREGAHVTASEVARHLGVTPGAVCRWETGKRLPRADVAARWGHLLRRLATGGGEARR